MRFFNCILCVIYILSVSTFSQIINAQECISLKKCIQLALLNSNAIHIQNYTNQINKINLASSLHSINPSVSISLSPVYNQSIANVTQPDGSMKVRSVRSASGLFSYYTTIPLSQTGGNLSIGQSFNFYRFINNSQSYSNWSINLYDISYSQPLSFFRRNKYIKQTAINNYQLKVLKKYPEILKIKKEVIECYFDIVKLKEIIKLQEIVINNYDSIKEYYNMLYQLGKCIYNDFELILIEIDKYKVILETYQNEKFLKCQKLSTLIYGSNKYPIIDLEIPLIFKIRLNYNDLKIELDSIQKKYELLIKNATKQQLAEAKTNVIDLPTITIGVGNNTNFEFPYQFKKNLKPSYNVSISYSTNLTDSKEKNRKLELALINYQIYKEELEKKISEELIFLEELYQNLNICIKQNQFLENSFSIHLQSLKIKSELLKAQKITLIEFNEQIFNIIRIKTEIINNIKNYYLNIANLECLLQRNSVIDL